MEHHAPVRVAVHGAVLAGSDTGRLLAVVAAGGEESGIAGRISGFQGKDPAQIDPRAQVIGLPAGKLTGLASGTEGGVKEKSVLFHKALF